MANYMDIVITCGVVSEDGGDYENIAVVEPVDANSQAEAITAGALLAAQHGFDGLLQGIRLTTKPTPDLVDGEVFLEGGIDALVKLAEERNTAQLTVTM